MDTSTLTIDGIEGIGPARRADLEAIGIHYVCDLLLTPPIAIASSTDLSMEMIEGWRTAALFLELDSMSTQWAEALVHGKLYDNEQLGKMSLEKLASLFAQAVEDNLINEIPDIETMASIKVEATKHHYCSQLQGWVLDESEQPIEGVTITCGRKEVVSNSKGFWKMSGLSFSDNPPLFARKDGYRTYYVENAQLDLDDWSTDLIQIQLIPGTSNPLVWDEYKGDQLPPLVSYKLKQLILGVEDIRIRDILKVTESYVNGDLKTISIFRSMNENQLNIHCYRISPEHFGETPEIGSYWCKRSSGLQPLGLGDESVLILRQLHNVPPPAYDPSAPWTQFFES